MLKHSEHWKGFLRNLCAEEHHYHPKAILQCLWYHTWKKFMALFVFVHKQSNQDCFDWHWLWCIWIFVSYDCIWQHGLREGKYAHIKRHEYLCKAAKWRMRAIKSLFFNLNITVSIKERQRVGSPWKHWFFIMICAQEWLE